MQQFLKPVLGIAWTLLFLLAACETPVDAEGDSDTEHPDTEATVPAAAADLNVSIHNGEVCLSWQNGVGTREGIRVYRTASGDESELIADLEANITDYTDLSAIDDTTYIYRLVAYNEFGESDPIEDTISVPQRYTITYHPGTGSTGGEVPVGATRYPAGDSSWIRDNTGGLRGAGIRDGIHQRFLTWNTGENGDGDDWLNEYFSDIQADVSLYAQYTKDEEVLGKIGPAGGLVFHERDDAGSGEWRFLEAAPAFTEWSLKQWGPDSSIDPTQPGIGTGADNTESIVVWLDAGDYYYEANYAAKLARGLDSSGYEWFLPAIDELKEMHTVLHKADPPLGSFGSVAYWSSTKGSDTLNTPVAMDFNTGNEQPDTPINKKRVRAARSF